MRKRPRHDLKARTPIIFKGVGWAGPRKRCIRAFFRLNGRHWVLDLGDRINGWQLQRITRDINLDNISIGLVPPGEPIKCEHAKTFTPGEITLEPNAD